MYIAQQCLGLSDEGEDVIYDIGSVRGFVGVDLTHDSARDATVDTTLITAPPSTKNKDGARDPKRVPRARAPPSSVLSVENAKVIHKKGQFCCLAGPADLKNQQQRFRSSTQRVESRMESISPARP